MEKMYAVKVINCETGEAKQVDTITSDYPMDTEKYWRRCVAQGDIYWFEWMDNNEYISVEETDTDRYLLIDTIANGDSFTELLEATSYKSAQSLGVAQYNHMARSDKARRESFFVVPESKYDYTTGDMWECFDVIEYCKEADKEEE